MATTKWKMTVKDEDGRARIHLHDAQGQVVGVASVAWHEYEKLSRQIIQLVLTTSRSVINDCLGKMMWDDAQRVSENSTELAMKKLAELGWTQETVDRYSDALARMIAQTLAGSLPEHR